MVRFTAVFTLLNLMFLTAFSQITVDEEKLSEAIKEKMIDEITERIKSSVESGEAWVAEQTYFSIVLEPFEPFGIDPSNPNFLTQAYDIHKKIEEELKKDPSLRYSSELKSEIKDIVKQGLWSYAGTFIDDDSKEIYEQMTELISDGKEKITELLEAVEGISDLDPEDEDYESEVVKILTEYGIESDYFYIIDDLDRIISKGYEAIEEPLDILTTVVSAVRSRDPVYKIEMLFDLGETYGGKIPVIGNLVTPLFTVGKEVLQAALRLENILENNLNQGCISPGGGTYGSVNKGKRYNFIRKFPDVERACPLNQTVYSPVYNNIYFNSANSDELFFYMNKLWFRGKKDINHKGVDDIQAAIQWLRKNGHADKAIDLDFIFASYQKEYGWATYTRELTTRINRIGVLFHSSYQTVQSCDDEQLKEFYMERMDFKWIARLLEMGELSFEWADLKLFNSYWEEEIKNRMIHNYYLSTHQHNLNNLDRIITFLTENVPVNFYGTVTESNGTPIMGAKLSAGSNSMFEPGDHCHQTTTSGNGNFSYYLLLALSFNSNTTVSANLPDGRTIVENITVHPDKKRFYSINLVMPYITQDTASAVTQDSTLTRDGTTETDVTAEADTTTRITQAGICEDPNAIAVPDPNTGRTICVCKPNYKADPTTGNCVIDIAALLSGSDCANDPFAIAEWDPIGEKVICTCVDNYLWDQLQKKCVPDIQKILTNSDCSKWPNTEAKWDYSLQQPFCDCIAGYVWNDDYTSCMATQDKLIAQSDCSHYPNTKPIWDPVNQEVICDCLPGFVWDEDYTKCITEAQEAVQKMDCSEYPNTQARWDPSTQQAYCDCIAGYQWNADYSACEPLQLPIQPTQPTASCDHIPNTHLVFDQATNQMFCDCNSGYQWNQDFTACEPVRRRPAVDWDEVLATAIGIMNVATGNYPGNGNLPPNAGGTGANQPPVMRQSNCNDQQQQGSDAPEIHQIDLGSTFGSFVLDYEAYSVKDQIIVMQGGIALFDSGCTSGSRSVRLSLNGFSSQISVRVNPNCDGTTGTQWTFTVHCPDQN